MDNVNGIKNYPSEKQLEEELDLNELEKVSGGWVKPVVVGLVAVSIAKGFLDEEASERDTCRERA